MRFAKTTAGLYAQRVSRGFATSLAIRLTDARESARRFDAEKADTRPSLSARTNAYLVASTPGRYREEGVKYCSGKRQRSVHIRYSNRIDGRRSCWNSAFLLRLKSISSATANPTLVTLQYSRQVTMILPSYLLHPLRGHTPGFIAICQRRGSGR